MILIVAGSRHLRPSSALLSQYLKLINFSFEADSIISGGAPGVDSCIAMYCLDRGIPFNEYQAYWKEHGKAAGPIRNKVMAETGDELLLIWDGESPGSKNMKEQMLKLGKHVHEVIIEKPKA